MIKKCSACGAYVQQDHVCRGKVAQTQNGHKETQNGHSRETTPTAPNDDSGRENQNKNPDLDCYNGLADHDWYKTERGLNYCRKCKGRQYLGPESKTSHSNLQTGGETPKERKDSVLPDCMMPDGDAPCVGYMQVYGRIEELNAENERLKADLKETEVESSELATDLYYMRMKCEKYAEDIKLATDALEIVRIRLTEPFGLSTDKPLDTIIGETLAKVKR